VPDYEEPVILRAENPTIEEFCNRLHKGLLAEFSHAWVCTCQACNVCKSFPPSHFIRRKFRLQGVAVPNINRNGVGKITYCAMKTWYNSAKRYNVGALICRTFVLQLGKSRHRHRSRVGNKNHTQRQRLEGYAGNLVLLLQSLNYTSKCLLLLGEKSDHLVSQHLAPTNTTNTTDWQAG
jgi:hypothetical protein